MKGHYRIKRLKYKVLIEVKNSHNSYLNVWTELFMRNQQLPEGVNMFKQVLAFYSLQTMKYKNRNEIYKYIG